MVSLIQNLASGGGRALVDIALGFPADGQTVLYGHPLGTFSYGLERDLDAAGIAHRYTPDQGALDDELRRLRTDVVLYHWWRAAQFHKPSSSRIPWIMINHNQLPAPVGYDFYVSVSKANYQIQEHLPAARREVIYNGISLDRFPVCRKEPGCEFVIGRNSHLKPAKIGVDYIDFLVALQIPNWRQIIIGDGPMQAALAERAAERGVADRICFAGGVNNREVVSWLQRFDIACHLTTTHLEAFSIAVLELLALGIPVVTEPKGGLPEQVVHNVNGFISCHRHDHKRYCELLARHPDLRARLSAGARQTAERFTVDRQRAAYREVISRL